MAFGFLDCWDWSIYFGIFASLVVLSLISVANQCSCKSFFNSIWNFASIFLSDAMHFTQNISGKNRLLVMVWLFANTILLSIFSGQLFEFIINAKIIDRIESKEELFTKEHWKSSIIYILDIGIFDFITYGLVNNNSMAKQFLSRSVAMPPLDIINNDEEKREIMKDVINNNAVLIINKLTMYFLVRDGQERYQDVFLDYIEGIDYYISQPEQSYKPYYIMFMREFLQDHFIVEFNKM